MKFTWVTFDCYGTLVDWVRGIGCALAAAADADGVALTGEDAVAAYMRFEPIVEAGAFRPYRDVLCETARRVAERFAWELEPERAVFLPESLPRWPLFDDTRPALKRLRKAGYKLGILSNVDLDLLDGTLRALDTEFEMLITAQEVGDYKPQHAHFVEARRRIGGASWLHAAQSYYHDVVPARELSIPVAWINRRAEAPQGEARPDREFDDLRGLADWLT